QTVPGRSPFSPSPLAARVMPSGENATDRPIVRNRRSSSPVVALQMRRVWSSPTVATVLSSGAILTGCPVIDPVHILVSAGGYERNLYKETRHGRQYPQGLCD